MDRRSPPNTRRRQQAKMSGSRSSSADSASSRPAPAKVPNRSLSPEIFLGVMSRGPKVKVEVVKRTGANRVAKTRQALRKSEEHQAPDDDPIVSPKQLEKEEEERAPDVGPITAKQAQEHDESPVPVDYPIV